jgi:putative transposase
LPKKIILMARERQRLIKYGRDLGPALKHLITVVTYRTFLRWLQDEGQTAKSKQSQRKPGRPRTDDEIRDLILMMGSENGWGYTRILGELRRLGIHRVSRTTVRNILEEAGLDPGPKRGHATWDEFIERHVKTLWACDFFTKKVWTCKGLVDTYVLFFIHYGTRRVHVTGITANPDAAWVTQQAKNMCLEFDPYPNKPRFLIHDFDTKLGTFFRDVFEDEGLEVLRVGPRKPNQNPVAERFVQSIKTEALDHFVVFGEDHLRYLVSEYVRHYNTHRPHQGLGNNPLPNADGSEPPILAFPTGRVVCDELLGGVIKQYRRVA